LLGPNDEPQESGAVVAVFLGDYRRQEIWVASGASIGNWYPLGGEFWVVWNRHRMPPGVTKEHPVWADVLARGPVTLLVSAEQDAYLSGWRAGRRVLHEQMEEISHQDPDEVDP
jgi:hypothetical protein